MLFEASRIRSEREPIMLSPVDVVNGEPMPFPYIVRARYQFQIDGVIAGTVLRAIAPVAPRHQTSVVAAAAVDAVEASRDRGDEVDDDRRLVSLDALSEWESPSPVSPWSRLHDVVVRSLQLVNAAGSETLRATLGGPLRRLAAT
jgi:hypothetical protein